jgi:hypothetical protein
MQRDPIMTEFIPTSAPSVVKDLIDRATTGLSALFSGVLFNVGCKLNLHQVIADLGACTSLVSLAITLARLIAGSAILAAARLPVVIGAISQSFGGVYQDRFPFAEYFGHRARPLVAEPRERKGTGS